MADRSDCAAQAFADPDPEKSERVLRGMLEMTRIDVDALERAAAQA